MSLGIRLFKMLEPWLNQLPPEIIRMIFEGIDTVSTKRCTLVCKKWMRVIRRDPKLTPTPQHITIEPKKLNYDTNFVNNLLLNWPCLKTLHLEMKTPLTPERRRRKVFENHILLTRIVT